jgi:hypothetical protein
MSGWIKAHRKIMQSWVYKDSDHFKVWMTMLFDANHEDKTTKFNGVNVTVGRGQFVFGRQAYSLKTGVSEAKIRNQLNNLVSAGMITISTTSRYSVITVLAYDSHQLNDQPSTVPATGSTTTSKEVKEVKKKEVKIGAKMTPPTLEEVKLYCSSRASTVDPKYFFEFFSESNWIDTRGNPVRNWKQKLITWEKSNATSQSASSGHRRPSSKSDRAAAAAEEAFGPDQPGPGRIIEGSYAEVN